MKIDLSRFSDRFRQETRDNLAHFDVRVMKLESIGASGGDIDAEASELIRITHAVKGAARMLGFAGINALCHALEELLVSIRTRGAVTVGEVNLIVEARRAVENLLSQAPAAADENGLPLEWLSGLISRLRSASEGASSGAAISDPAAKQHETVPAGIAGAPARSKAMQWRENTVRVNVDAIDDLLLFGRELTVALDGLRRIQQMASSLWNKFELRLNSEPDVYQHSDLLRVEDQSIERELNHLCITMRERIAEVDIQVRQIDSGAAELRMRPIQELFETIPLQVRDLKASLKKEVEIAFSGGGVRLDGRIIDMLGEPLVHVIRNIVDHGIEPPDHRESLGKPSQGTILVSAQENAGWAKIAIADDGRGIDLNRVWRRALELKLTDIENPAKEILRDGYRFLFSDRFTSKSSATEISGRGMGLAAVKRRMQELRGDAAIESELGMGTKITLNVPTSLSSQRVLVCAGSNANGGAMFIGIPTAMVKTAGLRERAVAAGEITGKSVSLSALLSNNERDSLQKERYVAAIDDGIRHGNLFVEQVVAETECIIEPLPAVARGVEIISGVAPIVGEQIMLIINVPALLSKLSNGSRMADKGVK